MPSFQHKKQLLFVMKLVNGTFSDKESNVIECQGFRASVDIDRAGGAIAGMANCRIYGLAQDDMNRLTSLKYQNLSDVAKNEIQIYAIDGTEKSFVFGGTIINAWADYQSMPEVCLFVQAMCGYYQQIAPATPRSFSGEVDVSAAIQQIAKSMGFGFEGNGVVARLKDQYLAGSDVEQMMALARNAGVQCVIDSDTVVLFPTGGGRDTPVVLLAPDTGMIGYPTFDGTGVYVRSLYNPNIKFNGPIKIESDVIQANGDWFATNIALSLESEIPGGQWHCTIRGTKSIYAIK